jgi:hypothetical protein
MSAVEHDERLETESELERVERWRVQELYRAGYDPEAVFELASRPDVDLHAAIALIKRGCPPTLALQIMR